MLINEIFSSIDGESKRAGELATFIRTVGCNLRCSYCDSKYTWGHEDTNKEMAIPEIIKECKRLGNHNITFTGGEPLLQSDADNLILSLAEEGFDVSIETNGAISFKNRIWRRPFYNIFLPYKPWVCIDYKCPSSGETSKMLSLDEFSLLEREDVIKFVVGSEEDLLEAKRVIDYIRDKGCECWVYLSPVFGCIEPKRIIEFMQENNMEGKIKFQLQIHKMIWDPDKRGV